MKFHTRKGTTAWHVLIGAVLIYSSTSGIFYYSYGVFLPVICEIHGWSRSMVSGALSLALLAFGLPGPLIGASIARFGPRANILCGNLLAVTGLTCMSLASKGWHLYLFFGIFVGLGAGFGMYMAVTTVVNAWFKANRSLSMGLLASSGGIGGLIFPLLTGKLIAVLGMQAAWLILAALQFTLAFLLGGVFLIRNSPEDIGGSPGPEAHPPGNTKAGDTGQVLPVLRRRIFWLITILCSANFFALGMITGHQVAYLGDLGFSPGITALSLGLVSGFGILGRLGFGFLGHRYGVRKLAISSFFTQILALIVLLAAHHSLLLVFVYTLLFGISCGALVVAMPIYIGEFFEPCLFTQTLGFMFSVTLLSEAMGPLVGGMLHDLTGTYLLAFSSVMVVSAIGLLCAFTARPDNINEPAILY